MSKQTQVAQGSAAGESTIKFKQMTIVQKGVHVVKVMLFFLTLGFAFAHILSND